MEDVNQFSEDLFSVASVLTKENAKNIIESDFKKYVESNVSFGIGQVEVNNLAQVDEVKEIYIAQLEKTKFFYGLDWTMLLITDVRKEDSILLCSTFLRNEKVMMYPLIDTHTYSLEKVLSRKKQLLPEIIRVIEEYY